MAGGGGGSEFEVDINLTALLDVLTNLLFFLMFGFASQKAAVELDSNVTLPVSSSDTSPTIAIRLTIAADALRVEKELIAPIHNGKVQGPRARHGGRQSQGSGVCARHFSPCAQRREPCVRSPAAARGARTAANARLRTLRARRTAPWVELFALRTGIGASRAGLMSLRV